MARTLLFGFIFIAVVALFFSCHEQRKEPPSLANNLTPQEVLQKSSKAIKNLDDFTYDFEFAYRDAAIGWAKGRVKSIPSNDLELSKIAIEGNFQISGNTDVDSIQYVSDGETTQIKNLGNGEYSIGENRKGNRAQISYAVFATLPEFFDEKPFWKELQSGRRVLQKDKRIDGELCYNVEVKWDDSTIYNWYISKTDFLPKGMSWSGISTSGQKYHFITKNFSHNLKLDEGNFRINQSAETSSEKIDYVLNDTLHYWEGISNTGVPIKSSQYRGKIVVLAG